MARNNEMHNVNKFLKESLAGRTFSGEYVAKSNREQDFNGELIIVDPLEVEFKADLNAVDKMLQIYKISNVVIENDAISKTTKIWASFSSREEKPDYGKMKWSIDSVRMNRQGYVDFQITRIENVTSNPIFYVSGENSTGIAAKEFFRHSSLLVVILIYFITEVAKCFYLIVFKIIEMAPKIVDSLMPLFLGFIEAVTKIVGGFYYLLAMMFNRNQPNQIVDRLAVNYGNGPSKLALESPRQRFFNQPRPSLNPFESRRPRKYQ